MYFSSSFSFKSTLVANINHICKYKPLCIHLCNYKTCLPNVTKTIASINITITINFFKVTFSHTHKLPTKTTFHVNTLKKLPNVHPT